MSARTQDPDQMALAFGASATPAGAARPVAGVPSPPAPPSLQALSRPAPRRRTVSPSRRRSFVLGRLTRRSREMRVLSGPAPIPGPWSLHASVHSPARPPAARLHLV